MDEVNKQVSLIFRLVSFALKIDFRNSSTKVAFKCIPVLDLNIDILSTRILIKAVDNLLRLCWF